MKSSEIKGRIILWFDKDEPECGWTVIIHPTGSRREYDYTHRFKTAGAALDAACKWATDRGLTPMTQLLTFNVIGPKNAKKPRSPGAAKEPGLSVRRPGG